MKRCTRCGALSDLAQVCAPCGEELCPSCYRPWTALACPRCRMMTADDALRLVGNDLAPALDGGDWGYQ